MGIQSNTYRGAGAGDVEKVESDAAGISDGEGLVGTTAGRASVEDDDEAAVLLVDVLERGIALARSTVKTGNSMSAFAIEDGAGAERIKADANKEQSLT